MTVLTYDGKKVEYLLPNYGTIPNPSFTENVGFTIYQTTIKLQIEGGETDKWNKFFNTCMRFSEEYFTGVQHLYTMENIGTNHQK